ncbi:MAG TPA: hypothetical protein VNL94_10050 [Candidatus Binatia bacterium]|nr:hypothetical protein [Candidatus Binatia bacterium]
MERMGWQSTVRGLLYAAMAVFLVTIGIGILNGLDLVTFERDQLLTHVHTGTLGWITLALVATSAVLAGGIDRRLALALGVIVPVYALAFLVAPVFRSVLGAILLLAILWLVAWAWGRYRAERSMPALAIALGFTTFTYGAIIGLLIQVQLATGSVIFPAGADVLGAHASAMVFSYLILVATGLLEWRVLGAKRPSGAGYLQLGFLFVSGGLTSATLLFAPGALEPVGGLVMLLNLTAIVIFVVRVTLKAVRTDWLAGAGRHLAASAMFVPVAMAIFLYVISQFIANPALAEDPTPIAGVLVASDHAAFLGVITNLVFGVLLQLTADRRAIWSEADHIAFWGVNGGLVVFLVGLVLDAAILKQVGAGVMGLSLLVGLATFAMRLRGSSLGIAPEPFVAEPAQRAAG